MSNEKRLTRRQLLSKAALLGAGLALAGPILAACGPAAATPTPAPKPAEKVAPVTPAKKEMVTIRYNDRAGELGEFMRKFSRVYEERNPNIKVENESLGWGDLVKKVAVAVAAGTQADVAFQHGALMLPELALKGAWLNLDPPAKADGHDFGIYWPWALDQLKLGPNGELVAMPMGVHTGQNEVMWNVEMLKNAGVKEPSHEGSVPELTEVCVKLKEKLPSGTWAMFNAGGIWTNEAHSRSWKGYITSPDRKKCGFDLKETQEAHRWIYDLINKWKVQPGREQIEGDQKKMFYAEKVAVVTNCAANIYVGFHAAVAGKFTLGHCMWPKLPYGVGTTPSADATVIYGKTKYPMESWGLVKLLSSFECSKWTAVTPPNMTPGAVKAAWNDPEVWKAAPPYKNNALFWNTNPHVGSITVPANTRLQEYSDTYNNEWGAMFYGDKPYNEANVKALQKLMQDIMDKPAP